MNIRILNIFDKKVLWISFFVILSCFFSSCCEVKDSSSDEIIRYYKYQREDGETYLYAFVIFPEEHNECSFYTIKENGKPSLMKQKFLCHKENLYRYKEDSNNYELFLSISKDTTVTWCYSNADAICQHFTFIGIEKIKLFDFNDSVKAYKFIEEIGNAPDNVVSDAYFDDSLILLKRQYKSGFTANFCMERISSVDRQFVNYVDSIVTKIKDNRKNE